MPTRNTIPPPPATRRSGAILVRDAGEGEPLVLLHGLGMTGDAFRLILARLETQSRLIVPDLRGHGQSAHLPGPYTTEALAADLAPALDALGVSSAHILGHSHGGAVAQVFARRQPERVRSLLLVSSYAVQRATWWQQMMGQVIPGAISCCGTQPMAWVTYRLRTAGGGRRLGAQEAALAAHMLAANDQRCLGDALRLSRQFDSRPWLNRLQHPTLVISGDADCIIVPQQAEVLARGIRGAHLRMLSGAGHALPLSHPAELAEVISTWLDHVDATRSIPDRHSWVA